MLIQFSLRNYKTFKERAILSLVASNYDKGNETNIIKDKLGFHLLKSAAIYGPNASGKSKLVEGMKFMREFVLHSSSRTQIGDKIDVEPFLFNTSSSKNPSEFEITLTYQGVLYRYGFEASNSRIIAEWLYYKPKRKEVELFYRDAQKIEAHARDFKIASLIIKQKLLRENALLISLAAQLNNPVAESVLNAFKSLRIISGLKEDGYQAFTMAETKNSAEFKKKLLELMIAADMGIQDIKIEDLDIDNLPKDMPEYLRDKIIEAVKKDGAHFFSDAKTIHRQYNNKGIHTGDIELSLNIDESSGTKKFFALSGPILDVLKHGYTLVIDELESKLHPNLVNKITSLFNSTTQNPHNAQLIFNTHDTNLLSSYQFRRDQIWFTDKNKLGETQLYSLSDFKTEQVRKSEPFEDNYIRGKYGAIPNLGHFEELLF